MDRNYAAEIRERINQSLLGIIIDSEYFIADREQAYVDTYWFLRGVVQVEKRGSIFTFRFENMNDKDEVILRSPLNINGALLLLCHWTPNLCFQNLTIPTMDLWLQIHGIPVEGFREDNIRKIACTAGEILVVDSHGNEAHALEFVRVKVRIPTSSPIVPATYISYLDESVAPGLSTISSYTFTTTIKTTTLIFMLILKGLSLIIGLELFQILKSTKTPTSEFNLEETRLICTTPPMTTMMTTTMMAMMELTQTPTHRTNNFTTEDIVALILQGSPLHVNPINPNSHSIPTTPLIPEMEDGQDEGTEDDPEEDPTELGGSSNSLGDWHLQRRSSSYDTTGGHISSPDSSDELGQLLFDRNIAMASHNSMQDDGLPSNLSLPEMDGVIRERYYEDWAITIDSLHNYREHLISISPGIVIGKTFSMQLGLLVTMTLLTALNSITPSTVRIKALQLFIQVNRERNHSGFQQHRSSPPTL
ncbi:hypothetical protein LIER_11169 [Lithospermum erythrorhizon]|uniref:DUF4283 domain-containing protein n=1 Tax=Lithospermum erythrorhizon TaxID=34254 RepID=A0AAV3PS75_LITER